MSEVDEGIAAAPLVIGRYALFDELAAGGMATVHLGALLGPVGFGRTVAIKRLHPHFLKDPEFVAMFMDEARIVARIRHPNVVPMVDVVQCEQGLFLVMEYVHGESLASLVREARKIEQRIPPNVVGSIMCGVLHGLHHAHETKTRDGQLLHVVHRDVSPQNIIVGADGVRASSTSASRRRPGRAQTTREGQIKGKLAYMAPEQIRGQVDRRTDVFAAAVVLWEMLAGRRMHGTTKDVEIIGRVLRGTIDPPSKFAPELSAEIDALVLKAISVDPNKRYATARDLAVELEKHVGLASASEVSDWVKGLASGVLAARAERVTAMEAAAEDMVADEFVIAEETTRRPPLSLPRTAVAEPVAPPVAAPVGRRSDDQPPLPAAAAAIARTETRGGGEPAERPPSCRAARHRQPHVGGRRGSPGARAMIGLALGGYALVRGSNAVTEPTAGDLSAAATTGGVVPEHPVPPSSAAIPSSVAVPASVSVPASAARRRARRRRRARTSRHHSPSRRIRPWCRRRWRDRTRRRSKSKRVRAQASLRARARTTAPMHRFTMVVAMKSGVARFGRRQIAA